MVARTSKLKTYLLEASSRRELEAVIPKEVKRKDIRRRRAVVVTDQRGIPQTMVKSVFPGDVFEAHRKLWLSYTRLDELHEEYLTLSPVPPPQVISAERVWLKAYEKRRYHEQEAERCKKEEYRASEDVIRTHGKGPVVIRDRVYYPQTYDEVVMLRPPPREKNS
jgi:hypothetical protein